MNQQHYDPSRLYNLYVGNYEKVEPTTLTEAWSKAFENIIDDASRHEVYICDVQNDGVVSKEVELSFNISGHRFIVQEQFAIFFESKLKPAGWSTFAIKSEVGFLGAKQKIYIFAPFKE